MRSDESVQCVQRAAVPNPGRLILSLRLYWSPPKFTSLVWQRSRSEQGKAGIFVASTTKELECPSPSWLMLPTTLEPFLPSLPSSLSLKCFSSLCVFFFFLLQPLSSCRNSGLVLIIDICCTLSFVAVFTDIWT